MSNDNYREQVKSDPNYIGSINSSALRDYFLTPSVSRPSGFNLEARYGAGSFAYSDDALVQCEYWERQGVNPDICTEIRKRVKVSVCHYCVSQFDPANAQGWRVNDRPTCYNCYSQFAEQGFEEDEPYGHCDSCGAICDGSGECACGGPIAIERGSLVSAR